MGNYFFGKLAVINYKMATHEGNANCRLASQSAKLLLLSPSEVPLEYRAKFKELITLVEASVTPLPAGLRPTKLGRIQNRTAVKYIKLLIDIEDFLREN